MNKENNISEYNQIRKALYEKRRVYRQDNRTLDQFTVVMTPDFFYKCSRELENNNPRRNNTRCTIEGHSVFIDVHQSEPFRIVTR